MQISQRKYLTIVSLLSITLAFLIYVHVIRMKDISTESLFKLSGILLEIGEWKGRDIALSERTYAILQTRNVIVREYTNPEGESLGLAIVQSAYNRSTFHPPEICYGGGGVELLNKSVETIDVSESLSIKTNKLVMKDKAGLQVAWYWFAVGDDFTYNYYLQQLKFVLNEILRRGSNHGTLISVSKRVPNVGGLKANERDKEFIGKMVNFLNTMDRL